MTLSLLSLGGGLVLLVAGADLLVRGASRLALRLGMTPLVVGLTIVALGTSAPELAVTVQSGAAGQSGMALGNVVGSNIFNVLVVLGLSALAAPLVVQQQLVRTEVPLLVGVSAVFWLMIADGLASRVDGLLLTGGFVAYTVYAVRQGRGVADPPVAAVSEAGHQASPGGRLAVLWSQIGLGLAVLVVGADWLVTGATGMARTFGVSDAVIGLTIVAAGTGLPELATSLIAAMRGARDIAVGNVIGSSLVNVMAIAGLAAVVTPSGLIVPDALIRFDVPVMCAVAVACLPLFASGYSIARWEGGLFVTYYAAYLAYVVLAATAHDRLPAFSGVMAAFVLPITGVTLLVIWSRRWRSRPAADRTVDTHAG